MILVIKEVDEMVSNGNAYSVKLDMRFNNMTDADMYMHNIIEPYKLGVDILKVKLSSEYRDSINKKGLTYVIKSANKTIRYVILDENDIDIGRCTTFLHFTENDIYSGDAWISKHKKMLCVLAVLSITIILSIGLKLLFPDNTMIRIISVLISIFGGMLVGNMLGVHYD